MRRKLHVPPNTRLKIITQHPSGTWRIWLSVNDVTLPEGCWRGSFIELHADGSAVMVTERPDSYDEYEVMEKANETCEIHPDPSSNEGR